VDLIFDVDELPMNAQGTKDAQCVGGVENVIQKIAEGDDLVVAHSASEEKEGQPDWDHSREVHKSEETVVQISVRVREGGGT
jgi:hypothetical protein